MWEMPHSNLLCSFLINSFSHWGIISSLVKVQSPLCEERWVNGLERRGGYTVGEERNCTEMDEEAKTAKKGYTINKKEG